MDNIRNRTLYTLTMEDAEGTLRELGHEATDEQLEKMFHRIRKGVEYGLGECWHDVMTVACEQAWDELGAHSNELEFRVEDFILE